MLKEILRDSITIINKEVDWVEAIKEGSIPLLNRKFIEERYVEAMINNINKLGSYVVLADKVAMINSSILIILASYFNTFGVILIPLVITSFFECGTAAVIAEGQGGLRGAIIGTIVASSLMVLLLGLSISVFSGTIQNWIMIFGGNDLSLWGIIANFFAKLIGG